MADYKEVLKLIEQAAKEGSTELDLSGKQLTSLPPEIRALTKLNSLELRSNQLTRFPPEITALTSLTKLDLRGNQLTRLPPEISQLTDLTVLNLSSNQLSRLPPEIAKLTKLTNLNLGGNLLTNLPLKVTELPNLTILNLSGQPLTGLPPEFSKLTKLAHLRLWGSRLTIVPQEIIKLTNLISLDLGNNQLTSLPPGITKLTNLTFFNLNGNPLPILPETLAIPDDVKAIFAAIDGLKSGERLNEAKMLVVGDGKVGKSSVVERLIHNTFNPHKQTTLGVEINDEMKIVQSEVKGEGEGEPVKLNIWDFGGQEIQHSTHQFFLTTRSLYLLVVDARKGNQLENIEYWLKLIESFGGDSPIIIVINQIDQLQGQRPLNLDRKALQAKYTIRDFVETSCETGQGIQVLQAAIAREIETLKHVRDVWPREWLAIKRRLNEMQDDYIPVEKYLEICGEENLKDKDLQQSLLDILHVLGTVVRFPGDTQVLNPTWVTQGVYGLLTSAQLVKDQGQFDLKDVGKILAALPDTDHYPSHTHGRLIRVMQHFELCFEFTDRRGHYLIPRHLHDNELDIPWDDGDALKFQYHYIETLPDAIISRFIVRMNQHITKQYYWKNGVFLHDGENRAKIKADLVDRKIFISIIGKEPTRRAFLAVIRSAFDEINSNFKIGIKQMIPLPDEPNVFVSYDALLVHENNGKQTIFVYEVEKDYEVHSLLDGVEDFRDRIDRRQRDLNEGRLPRSIREALSTVQTPLPRTKNNPLDSLMSFVLGFVVLLAAVVGAAVAVSKWVSVTAGVMTAVVTIAALLAIGVIGAMVLRNDDRLSEETFLKLIVESYKRLPLLRGKGESNNQLE